MTALQTIEKIGNEAVQKLRVQKLRSGHPFMIDAEDLEPNQCYLEYLDGSIKLVFLKESAREFTVIRALSSSEEEVIRSNYGLSRL